MMNVIYWLFIILILIIIYLLLKSISNKKIIWQKISFLYNNLYKILILDYYKTTKSKKLKEEIIDYYKNIVYGNNMFIKNKNWNSIKSFIKVYYKYNDWDYISYIFNDIDFFMLKYYRSISYNINILLFILAVCVTIFIVLIIN